MGAAGLGEAADAVIADILATNNLEKAATHIVDAAAARLITNGKEATYRMAAAGSG